MFLSFPGLLILSGFRRGLNLFIYIIKESPQRRFVLVFFLVDVGEQTTKKEINGDSSPRLLWAGWRPLYGPPASTSPDNNTSTLHYYTTPNTNNNILLSTFYNSAWLAWLIIFSVKTITLLHEVGRVKGLQYYMRKYTQMITWGPGGRGPSRPKKAVIRNVWTNPYPSLFGAN